LWEELEVTPISPEQRERFEQQKAKLAEEMARIERRLGSMKDQFTALGQFVQAFELMVAEARGACIDLIKGESGDTVLIYIALHHRALTAQPIVDIFKAMYGQIANDESREIPGNEGEAILAVVSQINKDYGTMLEVRNSLLHCT
jgi:hypothetical protein